MTNNAIDLINISKVFKSQNKKDNDLVAVNDINLEIKTGEFFTLLGPSGCGKTTTLRLIAGFEKPDSGEILINGVPSEKISPNQRPVNTVFQNYALFPHLNVAQNIAFGLNIKHIPKPEREKRVKDIIEIVRLENLAKRFPSQLSGGQQQRVAVARALVNNPFVLLLDEPFGALDLMLRKQMQVEMKKLQLQLGITFIHVTHDQEEALSMSDRIGVMSDGKLLQVDTPENIYNNPKTQFVAEFIGETNCIAAKVSRVENEIVFLDVGWGELKAKPKGQTFFKGQRVNLLIRPEMLNIIPSGKFNFNEAESLPGKIIGSSFTGVDKRYFVDVEGQYTFTALIRNSINDQDLELNHGDNVRVTYKKDQAFILN
ncbi:MAG: ABC transporter ATP-binding protein [Anaerolineaceae bacterium]|nr:ABC transporter ATP-binding protein [Anaerolineaceae bacterium]